MNTCDNCYWMGWKDKFCGYSEERPEINMCEEHNPKCEACNRTSAEYKLDGKYYCGDCATKETGLSTVQVTHYYYDWEHMGTDEDIDDVIQNACDNQGLSLEILE